MAAWKYIKGSEKDFLGAPDEAKVKLRNNSLNEVYCVFAESFNDGATRTNTITGEYDSEIIDVRNWSIIAQRELVTSVNDDRLAHDMGLNPKYNRPCKGVTIDVYDVLQAFNVTNPALQHLVKKALAVGQRGHKDASEDLKDILASAKRAIELSESNK